MRRVETALRWQVPGLADAMRAHLSRLDEVFPSSERRERLRRLTSGDPLEVSAPGLCGVLHRVGDPRASLFAHDTAFSKWTFMVAGDELRLINPTAEVKTNA